MDEKKLLKLFGKKIKSNELLADYSTMKVGGPARFLYIAENIEELVKIVSFANENKIQNIIIGAGSNVIFGDDGYNGLVIVNRASNIVFMPQKGEVIVDSGAPLAKLIIEAANRDLGGMENLYGIPGTVGGAVYGNAGANGVEICSFLKSITLLTHDNKIVRYKPEWLRALYRNTKIKNMRKKHLNTPLILSCKFQLTHNKKEDITKKIKDIITIRKEKQPYEKPSAGSIFRNLGTQKEKTAGFILDQVGAKKLKTNGAEVSKKHANFIINNNNAKASEILFLIQEMKKLAHDLYGVELEEEVEII